jgi:glycosyltransferase involved in cell wall biosynthesis
MTFGYAPDSSVTPIKRMAIAIDAFSRGGAQRNLQLLIPEWLAKEIQVTLFLIQNSNTELELENLERQGLKVVRVNAKSLLDFRSFNFFLAEIRKFNPEAIYANLFWSQIWSGLAFIRSQKFKVIWIEHNTYIARTRIQWLCYRILNHFTMANFAVSIEIREYLTTKSIKNLRQIRNCANPPVIPRKNGRERPHFVFLGRLVPQKNPILALQGFNLALNEGLIPSDSKLSFIGDGEMFADLSKLVQVYKMHSNVSFLGFLSQSEVALTLATSDCLISSSLHEGSPLARLEALSNGLCIVTTETAGIRGILTTDETFEALIPGVFVVPGTAKAIAQACQESLQNQYWSEDAVNSRQSSVIAFHPSAVADSYLSILN